MARKVNVLIAACLLFAVDAEAISGDEWRRLSQTAQQYYVIGVLDGWDNLGTITLLAERSHRLEPASRNGLTVRREWRPCRLTLSFRSTWRTTVPSGITTWHCWYGQHLMRCVHQQAND